MQNQTRFSYMKLVYHSPMNKQMAEISEETQMEGGILERWVLFVLMGIFFAIELQSIFKIGSKS